MALARGGSGDVGNAEVLSGCFERTYSAEHLAKNKKQTLQSVRVQVTEDYVVIDGTPRNSQDSYRFASGEKVEGAFCATVASPISYNGCVKIEKQPSGDILLSPVIKIYDSAGAEMFSRGLDLIRCIGTMSDGEGCMDTLMTVSLGGTNKDDQKYLLKRVSCRL